MKMRAVHGLFPALLIAAAMFGAAPAQAGSRAAEACRPLAALPGPHGLWLGHFSGGLRTGGGVEWRDDYACFSTARECRAWWNGLNRVYRHVQGHGTCLALRGGGRPLVTERTVLRTRY